VDISLDGVVPEGATLVVSENFYPGWTATVDGAEAPIGRADYVITGVALPAGAKSVALRFDNPNNDTGRLITLLALALAGALLIGGVVMDRRGARVV